MIKLKKNLIIGITGKHQSGKDTTLGYLFTELIHTDYPSPITLSLNVSAIETMAEIFECSSNFITSIKTHPVVRAALEFTGTEYLPKTQSPDKTILRLQEDIARYSNQDDYGIFLVSSVYKKFEADWIRNNGILIKITRPYYTDDRHDSYLEEEPLMPLEMELGQIYSDYLLANDNNLKRLKFSVADMLVDLQQSKKWKDCIV